MRVASMGRVVRACVASTQTMSRDEVAMRASVWAAVWFVVEQGITGIWTDAASLIQQK